MAGKQLKTRAEQEADARRDAEAHAQREADARRDAEAELAELREKLKRLEAKSTDS